MYLRLWDDESIYSDHVLVRRYSLHPNYYVNTKRKDILILTDRTYTLGVF